MFVYKGGKHRWKILRQKVEKLNNLIESFGFKTFDMSDIENNATTAFVTCQPSCITTVKFSDGTVKEIDHYFGLLNPDNRLKNLTRFENSVERIIGIKKYATPKLHIYLIKPKDGQACGEYIVVAASRQDAIDCVELDCGRQINFSAQQIGTASEYFFELEIILKDGKRKLYLP